MNAVREWLAVFVTGVGFLCMLSAQAATLDASVDRTVVEDGEIVQLSVELEGRNSDRPDTTPLQKDFEVLGTSSMTQMNLINGRASSSTRWIVNLRPRRVGVLTIPSLQSGGSRSQPITIRVGDNRQAQGAAADLLLETEISPQSPYVQAQLRYTVRLLHAIGLQSGQLSEPGVGDAVVHRAGEDRSYVATRNGRRYKAIERHYALFAQQSGELSIEAPVFEGQVLDSGNSRRRRSLGNGSFSGRDPFNGLMGRIRPVRVRGESRQVTIRPRPATASGRDWVPAHSVELSGRWEPGQTAMQVGEPVTLTLTTTVHGLTAAQLPEVIPAQLQGFSIYPDRAELETAFDPQGNARGTRVQKIAFIPRQAGDITIPEIVLRWWNTKTDQQETARLPARTLSVAGNPSANAATPGMPSATRAADATSSTQDSVSAMRTQAAHASNATRMWMWLSVLLGVVWAATLVMWLRDRRRIETAQSDHTATVEAQTVNERIARKEVLHACARDDAVAARRALLAWGAVHWPDNPPRGLEQIALRIDNPPLGQALLALDRALYTQARQWSAEALKALLQQLPKAKSTASARTTSSLPLHYAQTHAR